jgi:Domain of unknown function (DUF4258)
MAPSRLEISNHAKERLKQRLITRNLIRKTLALGNLVGTDLKGRKIKQKKFGKRILIVVYLENIGGQSVITSYWKGEFL